MPKTSLALVKKAIGKLREAEVGEDGVRGERDAAWEGGGFGGLRRKAARAVVDNMLLWGDHKVYIL